MICGVVAPMWTFRIPDWCFGADVQFDFIVVEVMIVDNFFELCVELLIQLVSITLTMHLVNLLGFAFNRVGSCIACNLFPHLFAWFA